jgi:hypothetical protein
MTIDRKIIFQAEPLRHLLQVADRSNAPAVWKIIEASNTKQVRQVLLTALHKTCFKYHVKSPTMYQALAQIILDPLLWHCS